MRYWCGLAFLLCGCTFSTPESATPIGNPIPRPAHLGLPALPPDGATEEQVALGKKLFFSTELSVDGSESCASCHNPAHGFAAGDPVAIGIRGQKGTRNAPTLLNAAFQPVQFLDGRASTLEEQASGPILNPIEMGHSKQSVARCCRELAEDFRRAYGSPAVTLERMTRALAAYERQLVSGNSPFDRYYFGKEKQALSPEAQRGFAVFQDAERGNCAVCHTLDDRAALFSDGLFHNLGVGLNAQGELTDLGRYAVTKRDRDRGSFRTPTLRNIARTAPYMHDGSLKTLKEVIDFYVAGGNANDYRDPLLHPLPQLTRQDKMDLIAFLESLTGEDPR